MYTFGGYNGTERLNDMYEYDFQTLRWARYMAIVVVVVVWVAVLVDDPRSCHSVQEFALYILGYNGQVVLNDFTSFDLSPLLFHRRVSSKICAHS